MAASILDSAGRRAALFLGCALLAGAPPWAATTHNAQAPINLEAASTDFDYRNNTLLFRRVKISQGTLQVEAQEASATGLEFENSQWSFKGQVRITVPDGKLASDLATVTFRNNEISRALVQGGPATFEQRLEDGRLAQGRAKSIEYDVGASTVRLLGDAWLSDSRNEIRGDTLVYDIARQRVAANPDETDPGGVRITINPQEKKPVTQETPPQEPTP
jgi:lipopolysaccharide export system protein LptA